MMRRTRREALQAHGDDVDHAGGGLIEDYLAALAARLLGAPRARADIVAELRCGLLDATDAHLAAGLSHERATRAAIAEFGDPVHVADAFRAELAARTSRRVAVLLLVTGPVVGLPLLATAASTGVGSPWLTSSWPPSPSVGGWCVLAAVAATVVGAVLSFAVTGRPLRWTPPHLPHPTTAAASAGLAAVAADALGLAMLATAVPAGSLRSSAVLAVLAGVAATGGLIRLLVAAGLTRRCLALRSAPATAAG